jgi:hypothetical protein
MRAIGHQERPAQVIAGLREVQMSVRPERDVAKVELIRHSQPRGRFFAGLVGVVDILTIVLDSRLDQN